MFGHKPSAEDADALSKAAVHFTMEFLVEEFESLKDLKSFVPPIESHPVSKLTAVPMAILFKDEKYKDKTIEIIQQLMEDAKLSGTPQVSCWVGCVLLIAPSVTKCLAHINGELKINQDPS